MFGGPNYDSRSALSNDARAAGDRADAKARVVQESARGTDERLDHLLLVCAAMWELLREQTNLTEDQLLARMADIDARDGVVDGKITKKPLVCPHCAHTVYPRNTKCLYCGGELPISSVFKTI